MLDEAQWFVHESVAEMLRLGRRRTSTSCSPPRRSVAPEPVAEAVWTNVADFVSFRGSPEEAREFARATRGVSAETVLSLPRGEAVVLLGKGNSVHWLCTARMPGACSGASRVPPPQVPAEKQGPTEPEAAPSGDTNGQPPEPGEDPRG